MLKRILSPVRCIDEFADEAPSLFAVEMPPALTRRIRAISALIAANGLHSAEVFCFDGVWVARHALDEDIQARLARGFACAGSLDALFTILRDKAARIEVPTLKVFANGFCFTGIPDGAGDSVGLFTPVFAISELDNQEPLVQAPE